MDDEQLMAFLGALQTAGATDEQLTDFFDEYVSIKNAFLSSTEILFSACLAGIKKKNKTA